jgi:hypothetical protein
VERGVTGEAARLLDAVGLRPAGRVRWGQPIRCDKAGVYLVEIPALYSIAAIDTKAVAGWLERVPRLELDGRRPTPRELAARLRKFWIASRSVVYIGRTTAPLAERIAAFYATPLGDRSPHAGGHWLKTLRLLKECWVSWATTEYPSRSEDELFLRFAATVSPLEAAVLFDSKHVLPFANLEDAHKVRKRHGMRYQRAQ